MIENIKCIFMFPEIQYKVWYYFTVLFNHLAGSGCEFGPGCRFPCHCQGDTSCNLLTGSCSAGCDDGSPSGIHWPGAWEGPGCQIGKDMMTSWHGNTMCALPDYWPFVRGIHQWPRYFPHSGTVTRSFEDPLLFARKSFLANSWVTGDWRLCDLTVMRV